MGQDDEPQDETVEEEKPATSSAWDWNVFFNTFAKEFSSSMGTSKPKTTEAEDSP
jgi:hypothetical protein